jgi:hypothetical protein
MRAAPRQIIEFMRDPEKWDEKAFETSIRNEVESNTGNITASDELLIGSLVMTVDMLVKANLRVQEDGPTYEFHSGEAPSAWYKIRTESLDKSIKILAELALVARGRPKKSNKVSDVDELFATA